MGVGRVLATKSVGCPEVFDCNSYIRMVDDLSYQADIPGHHAMRVVPILLVRGLLNFGISIESAFHWVSGTAYVGFGMLSYWVIVRLRNQPLHAFSWALILMALHHAMRIPLYLVYSSNDALVYPIGLAMLYLTWRERGHWVFVLGIVGTFTRQNLFVLGLIMLGYLALTRRGGRRTVLIVEMLVLTASYLLAQSYYHAQGVIGDLLVPSRSFFSLERQIDVLSQSRVLDLGIVLIPFTLFLAKPILSFLKQNLHWVLYAAIAAGVPYLGFDLVGNNFQRLALQGVWVIALAVALSVPTEHKKFVEVGLLVYALAVFATFGALPRWGLVGVLILLLGWSRIDMTLDSDGTDEPSIGDARAT